MDSFNSCRCHILFWSYIFADGKPLGLPCRNNHRRHFGISMSCRKRLGQKHRNALCDNWSGHRIWFRPHLPPSNHISINLFRNQTQFGHRHRCLWEWIWHVYICADNHCTCGKVWMANVDDVHSSCSVILHNIWCIIPSARR